MGTLPDGNTPASDSRPRTKTLQRSESLFRLEARCRVVVADHSIQARSQHRSNAAPAKNETQAQRTLERDGLRCPRKKAFETRGLRAITGINMAGNREGFGKVTL